MRGCASRTQAPFEGQEEQAELSERTFERKLGRRVIKQIFLNRKKAAISSEKAGGERVARVEGAGPSFGFVLLRRYTISSKPDQQSKILKGG